MCHQLLTGIVTYMSCARHICRYILEPQGHICRFTSKRVNMHVRGSPLKQMEEAHLRIVQSLTWEVVIGVFNLVRTFSGITHTHTNRHVGKKQNNRKGVNTPAAQRDSHCWSWTNRLSHSQTTSTQKITLSTGTRQQSSPVSLTELHGGSGRLWRFVRRAKASWIETRAPTSWIISTTNYCSICGRLVGTSHSEEGSSCCQNVNNLWVNITVVICSKFVSSTLK